ncbi:TlpA disulfide reductase family protein [Methylocystis echinoides]|uniref:TlpA family protein disulfide reductase n=1 Tax=Methylocystis echinoides TaxID=29468 RepID=UPI00341FA119
MNRMSAFLLLALLAPAPAAAEIIGANPSRAVTEAEMRASLKEIALADESGAPFDLRAAMANGKPTLVSLWAHWCPNCIAEIAGFKAIAATCPQRWNLVFVSARPGDYAKDLAKFSRYRLPWPIHRVGDAAKSSPAQAKAARAFYGTTADGGVSTPLHYLLSSSGVVNAIVNGRLNFDEPARLAAFCAL